MKNFSISMYETKEQLLEAKIEHLEKRNSILLNRLHLSKRTNREDKQRLKNEIDYWLSIANKWKRKYREVTNDIHRIFWWHL